MKLNAIGEWCAGIGGTTVSYGGKPIASPAGGANWMDVDHIVYQVCTAMGKPRAAKKAPTFKEYQAQMRRLHGTHPERRIGTTGPRFGASESCKVERYNVRTGVKDTLFPHGANFIEANGGIAAVWFGTNDPNTVGITLSDGRRFPAAGLGTVGPDGAVAIKDDYQSAGPWTVHEQHGSSWRLFDQDAFGINLLGNGRAVFAGTGVGWVGKNMPAPTVLPGAAWWLRVIEIAGAWWSLYQREDGSLVLHPFGATVGYRLAPPKSLTYRPDIVVLNGTTVRVVWASREDEGPDVQHVLDVNTADPRIELLAAAPPPPPPPPPPPEKPMYRQESDVLPYMQQRWRELDVAGQIQPIKDEFGVTDNRGMERLRDVDRGSHDRAEEKFRAIQAPAFFRIVGELYWQKGFKDVGLGRKTGGTRWEDKATDIIVLKPLNGDGKVRLVDAINGAGYPEAAPTWGVIEDNPERTWVEPPRVEGPIEPPPFGGETHRYIGGGNDTGTCDQCGQPKFSPIHLVPEGMLPHEPWQGEDGIGDCDLCFQPVDAPIHNTTEPDEPDEPEEPTVEKHDFVGSATAKFCAECGKPRTDPIHQKDIPGGTVVDMSETNDLLRQVVDELKGLRADVVKSGKTLTEQLLSALPTILALLAKRTPAKKGGGK